jgi:hypothetical protein
MTSEEIDQNSKEAYSKFDKIKEDGLKNISKYFDRIHDKLFITNNILIGGYFALSKIDLTFKITYIIFPFLNLIFLIYVEYKFLKLSKFEAEFDEKTNLELKKYPKIIQNINLLSLLTILITLSVLIFFSYNLLK